MINRDNLRLNLIGVKGLPNHFSLYDVLDYLYIIQDLSSNEVANLSRGEISHSSVLRLLRGLGIKIKGRGGNQYGR